MEKTLALGDANKVLSLSVDITSNGKTIFIPSDSVKEFQIDWDYLTFELFGTMLLTDDVSFSKFINFNDAFVKISYMDFGKNVNEFTFKIVKSIESSYSTNLISYFLVLRDKESFVLSRSFLGKGYSGDSLLSDVLYEFFEELGLDAVVLDSTLKSKNLIVPKNISNLDFFKDEIRRQGGSIFRLRDGKIKILRTLESEFKQLKKDEIQFKEVNKREYLNRILNYSTQGPRIPQNTQNFTTYQYNFETKEFDSKDVSSMDMWSLNPVKTNVLETKGVAPVIGKITEHEENLRRQLLDLNKVTICTHGSCARDLNTIIDIVIGGNQYDKKSSDFGDAEKSGMYAILAIKDKYVGGHFLQQLVCGRPDGGKASAIESEPKEDKPELVFDPKTYKGYPVDQPANQSESGSGSTQEQNYDHTTDPDAKVSTDDFHAPYQPLPEPVTVNPADYGGEESQG